jgi:hypothetical protein
MSNEYNPEITTFDGPLCVLKYRREHVVVRAFVFSLGVIGFLVVALMIPLTGTYELVLLVLAKLFCGLLSFGACLAVIDLLLLKEILLYQDKIVKVWRLLG